MYEYLASFLHYDTASTCFDWVAYTTSMYMREPENNAAGSRRVSSDMSHDGGETVGVSEACEGLAVK